MPSNPPHVAGITSGIPSKPAVFREYLIPLAGEVAERLKAAVC
jgi:hypothetical protein